MSLIEPFWLKVVVPRFPLCECLCLPQFHWFSPPHCPRHFLQPMEADNRSKCEGWQEGKRFWRRRSRLMTERHGAVFSARRQICGRVLNVVVARLAFQQFCRSNTCTQRCRRSPVGRSRHRQVMVKTGHMPTRQNGHYKRSHESCTEKTRSLRRRRNTAKCRSKVQGRVLKMMKVKRWT